jgi:CheY-like chemotaxis protein
MVEIILLEDNLVEATLFESAIEETAMTYQLHVTHSYKLVVERLECWQKESNPHPKIIFLDMHTPEMTGLEILEKIKSYPILKKCTVAMLTGLSDDMVIKQAYESGINAYLYKPIDFDDLVNMIESMIKFFSLPESR